MKDATRVVSGRGPPVNHRLVAARRRDPLITHDVFRPALCLPRDTCPAGRDPRLLYPRRPHHPTSTLEPAGWPRQLDQRMLKQLPLGARPEAPRTADAAWIRSFWPHAAMASTADPSAGANSAEASQPTVTHGVRDLTSSRYGRMPGTSGRESASRTADPEPATMTLGKLTAPAYAAFRVSQRPPQPGWHHPTAARRVCRGVTCPRGG